MFRTSIEIPKIAYKAGWPPIVLRYLRPKSILPGRRDDVPIPLMEQTSVSGTADPPRSRKSRAADCIEKAIAENKPLPLEVVLDVMWFFNDAAQRFEVSGDPDDARLSRTSGRGGLTVRACAHRSRRH
jgi:hypothetical protein